MHRGWERLPRLGSAVDQQVLVGTCLATRTLATADPAPPPTRAPILRLASLFRAPAALLVLHTAPFRTFEKGLLNGGLLGFHVPSLCRVCVHRCPPRLEHVAREHVGSDAWPSTSLSSGVWLHLLCAGAFVIVGATLNALHPVFANRGYQHGRVVLISTHTALTSMASGVFVGITVLVRLACACATLPAAVRLEPEHERLTRLTLRLLHISSSASQDEAWPARPMMSATRFLAFGFMVYGVIAMNWGNIRALAASRVKAESPSDVASPTLVATAGGPRDVERLSPGSHPATRRV